MQKILEYFLSLLIILECNSVYSRLYNTNNSISIWLIIVLGLLIIISLIKRKNVKRINILIPFFIFYFMYIGIYMLHMSEFSERFIYLFIISLPMFILYYSLDKNNIMRLLTAMANTIFFLCFVSILFWLSGSILNIIKPTGTAIIDWGYIKTIQSYHNIYFETQYAGFFNLFLTRNSGIFAEAPMHSLVLTTGLMTNTLVCKEKSKFKNIILCLGILSTLSTAGIIIAIVVLGFDFVISRKKKTNDLLLYLILALIITVIVIVLSFVIIDEKSSSISYLTRIDDYISCINAWKTHLIFGNGFNNELAIRNYMSQFRVGNMGLSNSLLTLLALGGLYLSNLYIIPFIISLKYYIRKNKKIIFYIFMILALFIVLIFHYKVLIINYLAIGYSLIFNRKDGDLDGE